jgi:hypothetical protein
MDANVFEFVAFALPWCTFLRALSEDTFLLELALQYIGADEFRPIGENCDCRICETAALKRLPADAPATPIPDFLLIIVISDL